MKASLDKIVRETIEEAKNPENTESKIKLGDWVRVSKTKKSFRKGTRRIGPTSF